ncbi:MAG: ribosome assembly RNA-binding protein YhbY [Rubricoccaceae bacterium]
MARFRPPPPAVTLTTKQRAHLRSLAHPLKPEFHVGKEGVTVPVLRAIRDALRTRELLKVRVLEAAPEDVRATAAALAEGIEDSAVVQTVGRIVTLYRPDPDAPQIRLPK